MRDVLKFLALLLLPVLVAFAGGLLVGGLFCR